MQLSLLPALMPNLRYLNYSVTTIDFVRRVPYIFSGRSNHHLIALEQYVNRH